MTDIRFDYIDKKEAAFLLGTIKHVDCFNCPCFHLGCDGNYPQAQIVNMTPMEYLYSQKKGTETFLCGKLRNIIIAEDMKLIDVGKTFDSTMKQDIAYLNKLVDKCVVKTGNYDLEVRNIEFVLQKKLDGIVEEHNKHILALQTMLSDKEKELAAKENEWKTERAKLVNDSQYVNKMHDTITSLQRTIFEQNQKLTAGTCVNGETRQTRQI